MKKDLLYEQRLKDVWYCMVYRCYNPKCKAYRAYGAKGVRVCKLWKENKIAFCKWAMANGWKPGLQLDKDIIGTGKFYSPKNCLFVTRAENRKAVKNYNSPYTKYFFYKGKKRSITQLSKDFNISREIIKCRLKSGMDIKDVMTIPIGSLYANKKPSVFYLYKGAKRSIKKLSSMSGLKEGTIRQRIRSGLSVGQALNPFNLKYKKPTKICK